MFLWRLKMNSRYHPLVLLGAAKRAYLFNKKVNKKAAA
jgi:hypothetical protein